MSSPEKIVVKMKTFFLISAKVNNLALNVFLSAFVYEMH